MRTEHTTTQEEFPGAVGPVNVVFSQPTTILRWNEITTECRHLEGLFLQLDDARDGHIVQLCNTFPQFQNMNRVVRNVNVKMDQQYPESGCQFENPRANGKFRARPYFGQLYRVETSITNIGRTSARFQHRLLTVPQSQAKRNFNNRAEDQLYAELKEDDEPERCFASAEGSLVFIKWMKDEKGHKYFKPTPGIFTGYDSLAVPSSIKFLKHNAPISRSRDSPRPQNAFKVEIHLRKSDEDELGHVTNSRYAALLHDVLTFGLRKGYYANGAGTSITEADLPKIPSQRSPVPSETAVLAGSRFYKYGNVMELYVGYERELKVKPGVYIWSWVEPEKTNGLYDCISFEICSVDNDQEKIVSLSRAMIIEDQTQRSSL
ncbi:hypothetical protein BGZ76_005073 [Entomortierella beljakovae]|nr:hypothetical protein BGZ76_005073 [Entomortierella beljakovae]